MKPQYIKPDPAFNERFLGEIEDELLALQWETKRTARHEYFMADGVPCDAGCHRGLIDPFPEGSGIMSSPVWCTKCGGTGTMPLEYRYENRAQDAELEAKRLEWVRNHPEEGSLQERVKKASDLFPGVSYLSKPFSPWVKTLASSVAHLAGGSRQAAFNGCFLNKYDDQYQHLGWHADDFSGMDPDAPIAVMSFGAEREIWIKKKWERCPECEEARLHALAADRIGSFYYKVGCSTCDGSHRVPVKGVVPPEDRYLLQRGSIFIMPPGFQEEMYHRIPKHPEPCGWRISLTFRKFL